MSLRLERVLGAGTSYRGRSFLYISLSLLISMMLFDGAVAARRDLEEAGLGSVIEDKATRGTNKVPIFISYKNYSSTNFQRNWFQRRRGKKKNS